MAPVSDLDPRKKLRGQKRAVAARNIQKGEVIEQYVGRVLTLAAAREEIKDVVRAVELPSESAMAKMTWPEVQALLNDVRVREQMRPERLRAVDYHFNALALAGDEFIPMIIDPYPYYGNCTMLINHFESHITHEMIQEEWAATESTWDSWSQRDLEVEMQRYHHKAKGRPRMELIQGIIQRQLEERFSQNCANVQVRYQGWPYQTIVAIKDIPEGGELLLDYGESFWATREILHDCGVSIAPDSDVSLLPCFQSYKTQQSLTPSMVELKNEIQRKYVERYGPTDPISLEQRTLEKKSGRVQRRELALVLKPGLTVATVQALHNIDFGHSQILEHNSHTASGGNNFH